MADGPAVLRVRSGRCLSFSSSSEGGTFQLRRRGQVPTVQTPRSGAVLGVVAMPVVVQRLAPESGQFRQLWLLSSGGGTAAAGEGGGRRLRLLLGRV